MGDERMTEEQRAFAEKNYGLVFSFMAKHGYDPEEYYGDAAIGLCRAAMNYQPDMGNTFSTFAYSCMQHQCLAKLRSDIRKSRFNVVSLEDAFHDDSALRFIDVVSSGEDLYASAESVSILMRKMKDRLSLRELQIILLRLQGKTLKEIAGILGCSWQNVSLVMQKIQKAMTAPYLPARKKMGDDGLRGVLLQLIAETIS